MPLKREVAIENALSSLLDALAQTLISLEITPTRLSQIARVSFVKAGATRARKRSSGRPHLAKIAALTGLSRLEVKKIVSSNFVIGRQTPDNTTRAQRVYLAWQGERPYVRNGSPIPLRMEGKSPSFRALCREHSGDIPHTVILKELERTGRVKLNKGRDCVSLVAETEFAAQIRSSKDALLFASAFLTQALAEEPKVLSRQQHVPLPATVPIAYAEKAIANRVNELLDQAPRMFPRRRRGRGGGVQIYALVSRKPSK